MRVNSCKLKKDNDLLKLGAFGSTGKWDHIADICHTGNKLHQPFKAKPKARVRTGAESPCV